MALSGIAGQQRAVRFLKRLLERGAVPHALLFSGIAGAGKYAAAIELAKALNCLHPQDHDACGRCASCRKLEEGLHPDLVHLRSEGVFIKLEQVRDMMKRFRFRPFEGKFRVVIIEDAQKLMEAAANAMLKTLEEPPEANVFILLAAESQMLLPTIVSRCTQVRFQPLEDLAVAERLFRDAGVSREQAAAVARLSGGSFEKARWLSQEDGAAAWEKAVEKLERLEGLSILDFFPMVSDWAKDREGAGQDLEFIRLWVRDLVLFRVAGESALTFQLNDRTRQAAASAQLESLFFLHRKVEQAMQGLQVNANLQMTLEGVCLAIKDCLYGKGDWNSFPKRRQDLLF